MSKKRPVEVSAASPATMIGIGVVITGMGVFTGVPAIQNRASANIVWATLFVLVGLWMCFQGYKQYRAYKDAGVTHKQAIAQASRAREKELKKKGLKPMASATQQTKMSIPYLIFAAVLFLFGAGCFVYGTMMGNVVTQFLGGLVALIGVFAAASEYYNASIRGTKQAKGKKKK